MFQLLPTTMLTPHRINHPYARRGSPVRPHHEDERGLNEGEPQLEVEEVIATAPPQLSRFHVFTDLARAVRTRVSYMWGSFRRIITPVRNCSSPLEQVTLPTPQDMIRGQLNKGWVLLSEHLPRDYDEVLTRDRLHCLETTIANALMTCSMSLPNCLPLLQEVEKDICNHVQLMSAQSDATAWYTVLGTYTILASHINNLTSHPAHRGLFPDATATSTPQPLPPLPSNNPSSTPQPLPPLPPNNPSSTPNASLSTTLSVPTAAPPLPSPALPSPPPAPTSPPLPSHLPPPPPPPASPPPPPPPSSFPSLLLISPASPNAAPSNNCHFPLSHFPTSQPTPPSQIPLPPPLNPYSQPPSTPLATPTPPPLTTSFSRADHHRMQHLEQEMFRTIPVLNSAYPREFSRWIAQMDQLFTGSGYDISHARSILGIKLSGSARTNVLHNIRHAQSWAEIRTTLV